MDFTNTLRMGTDPVDTYWETYRRRNYSERDWVRDFYAVREMFDGNENAWSPVERHERLAEAMYE